MNKEIKFVRTFGEYPLFTAANKDRQQTGTSVQRKHGEKQKNMRHFPIGVLFVLLQSKPTSC